MRVDVELTYAQTWDRCRRLVGALGRPGHRPGRSGRRRRTELPPVPRAVPGRARRRDGARAAEPAPHRGRAALRAGGLGRAGAVRRAATIGGLHGVRRARHRPRRRATRRCWPRPRPPSSPTVARRTHLAGLFYTGGTTGAAEGRDAHPPQPRGQRLALPGLLPVPARHVLADRRPAVPRRRLHRRAGHRVERRAPGRAARVRPGAGARPHRAPRRDRHAGRADDAGGAQRRAAGPSARRRRRLRTIFHGGSPSPPRRCAAPTPPSRRRSCSHIYGATETAPIATTLRDEERVPRRAPHPLVRPARRRRRDRSPRRRRGRRCRPARSARSSSAATTSWSATGTSPSRPPRRSSTAGTTPATSATWTTRRYVYLVDRAKDMIVTGGENVYSTEVEDVLYRHPAVLEAAVFGVPDDHWGEAVHAVVVPRSDVTERRADRALPGRDRRLQGAQADRAARPSRCRSRAPARCSSASCASRTGPAREPRVGGS